MNCELEQTTLQGYFDGELDPVRTLEFERHLETCRDCQGSLQRLESLRTQLREARLYVSTSPEFDRRIRRQLGIATAAPSGWFKSFLVPAFATVVLVFAVWFAVRAFQPDRYATRVTAELLDAHVRSLQPGHLADVQSTDQHTVKPWFDGKLDFIPPVADFSAQGFPLLGGRLDVIDARNVAVLVYGRRKHFINVFVWPNEKGEPSLDGSGSRQGYNWVTWRSGEMQLCAVSDAAVADLEQLKQLIHP